MLEAYFQNDLKGLSSLEWANNINLAAVFALDGELFRNKR
jgi:hypothetical protein